MGRKMVHGMCHSPEYLIWNQMIQRCYNKNQYSYNNYGGRGIKVCPRWLDSFVYFHDDMGNKPSIEYSIDRINNDGNYEPSNCRWATKLDQASNRRERSDNKFGHRGICTKILNDGRVRWVAYFWVNNKSVGLGTFNTRIEAINARLLAEQERSSVSI